MASDKPSQEHICRACKTAIPNNSSFGPFCSSRCKMNDLSRWFSESYGIEAIDDDGGEATNDIGEPHQQKQD